MDKIILSGIDVFAHGGVTEAERATGQRYRVHIELSADLAAAAGSDSVDDTIHYGHVHDAVVEIMRGRQFKLLESVTGRIAEELLERFKVSRVTVRVEKLLPPIDGVVASAAVEMTRS